MRLIDADKLKEEIKRLLGLAHDREAQTFGNGIPDTIRVRYQTQYNERSAFCNLIDNAPTVEFPEQITIKCDTEEDKQKLLSALRNAKLKVLVEEERPTGKWIYSETEYDFVCSECGEKPVLNTYDTPNITDLLNYKFCRNCGAKMRVKNELNNELEEVENEGLL